MFGSQPQAIDGHGEAGVLPFGDGDGGAARVASPVGRFVLAVARFIPNVGGRDAGLCEEGVNDPCTRAVESAFIEFWN